MAESKRRRLNATVAREMLDRFAGSGLSARAFCEREELSPASFYRWRSLLSAEGGAVDAKSSVSQKGRGRRGEAAEFIELGALGVGGARVEVRLDLGGGVLLSVVRG